MSVSSLAYVEILNFIDATNIRSRNDIDCVYRSHTNKYVHIGFYRKLYLCFTIKGNLLQLKKDRVRVMSQWIKQYGKHFGYYNGAQPVVVCSDLDTLRHILIKVYYKSTLIKF